MDLARLKSRKELLGELDNLRREVDAGGEMRALEAFSGQALDILTSGRARRAFDLSDEKPETLDRYRTGGDKFKYLSGPAFWDWQAFVRARRLVEAGVPFVSMQVGLWDHHCDANSGSIFEGYRSLLPLYDICLSALINDLHERGLHQDVCVVVWGEFGRTPRINQFGGRDITHTSSRSHRLDGLTAPSVNGRAPLPTEHQSALLRPIGHDESARLPAARPVDGRRSLPRRRNQPRRKRLF